VKVRDRIASGYLRGTTYLRTPFLGMIPMVTLFVIRAEAVCATSHPLFKGNISVAHGMPLPIRLKGSIIMSPPGFQIKLWPPVTLTFDLLSSNPRSTIHALALGKIWGGVLTLTITLTNRPRKS